MCRVHETTVARSTLKKVNKTVLGGQEGPGLGSFSPVSRVLKVQVLFSNSSVCTLWKCSRLGETQLKADNIAIVRLPQESLLYQCSMGRIISNQGW